MPTKKYRAVLFDLDGTLLDTSQGILNCISYTEEVIPLPTLSGERKRSFIGPPLLESFRREYSLDEEGALRAAGVYRERYREKGMLEAQVYPDIPGLLAELKNAGYMMAVATLKLGAYADKVISSFGLSTYFHCVCGTDEKGTVTKAEIIARCLNSLGAAASEAVLIGDSNYDREGARQAGVDFIGVSYGFGFKPDGIADSERGFVLADSCADIKNLLL